MNNIYTSHCFLMKNNSESVHQIWDKFDKLENKSQMDSFSQSKMNVAAKPFYQSEKKKGGEHLYQSENKKGELNEKNLFMFDH
jgi:hypothetical protein